MLQARPLSPTIETIPTNHKKMNQVTSDKEEMKTATTENTNKRRVHFSDDENDSQSAPHQELTLEMITDMWHTPEQINYFKQSAKYVILNKENLDLHDDEFAISGLERYGPKRSEYKRSALFYTLHAQHKSRNPEFIRAVARRCTGWARSVATEQGFADYCDVYDPLARLLADPNASVSLLKAVNKSQDIAEKRLRPVEDEESAVQSKRQRLS
mmetsp:Transcript_40961/g.98776  ORF Transcript_40961/g.98776 Transcript_40961/m.98776 type:complete len:213 (-) Transcript_40961:92-730(-)|eukprot:CAMPEP_0113633796 /NCGR_PEP_ID=MMETSP0017_2-20120614/17594_1 /TAXON_ID=2856 /ORGANISM="Cylindrotheca closterium" /LENGTH=212 /DNA_ID=CAMNT_0000544461 /DNA_START=72 /DNA_END=710 /DNA_ORIENTATION=+ /assembly_acc=CAM_ASM_000147